MARSPDFNYNRTISDVISKSNKPHLLPETGWNLVGLSSGEANTPFEGDWQQAVGSDISELIATHDGTDIPVSWYHDEHGEVRLRGFAQTASDFDSPVGGHTIFTLPEEARPETTQSFVCVASLDYFIIDLSTIRFRAWIAGTEDAG